MKKHATETITIIKHDLKDYFAFLEEKKEYASQRLREDDLYEYKDFLADQGLEETDINHKVTIIKRLLFSM